MWRQDVRFNICEGNDVWCDFMAKHLVLITSNCDSWPVSKRRLQDALFEKPAFGWKVAMQTPHRPIERLLSSNQYQL